MRTISSIERVTNRRSLTSAHVHLCKSNLNLPGLRTIGQISMNRYASMFKWIQIKLQVRIGSSETGPTSD
jgi:hypothetical protein